MKRILHISNTDILGDSRILKELSSISTLRGIELFAIGLHRSKDVGTQPRRVNEIFEYHPIVVLARVFRSLPRACKYSIELIEFTLRALIVAIRLRPDIVHCHDTFALPCAWLSKRIIGSKLIYDAHELESNKNGQSNALSRATLWIEKFCWPEVDYLVSVSNSIISWYRENLGEKPSVLVLNSPQFARLSDVMLDSTGNSFSLRSILKIAPDAPIFVHVGILGPGRGIRIYLECFSRNHGGAHLVIVGDGELRSEIEEYAKICPNIHHLPPVEHSQVVPLLRSATFGLCLVEAVSLSDYYCLPNKLFEYAFSGIRVIASSFPDISRLVNDYSLGYCCEPSLDALERKVKELLAKPCAIEPRDLTPLSWEAQAERLLSIYMEVGCTQGLLLGEPVP